MFDLTTLIVYIGLLAILIFLAAAHRSSLIKADIILSNSKLRFKDVFGILIIAVVVGFRYEVGVDWEGYKNDFTYIKNNSYITYRDQYYEFVFFHLNKLIAVLGLSYQWMFLSIAVITWYFYYKSVPPFLLPLLIFFLFVDEYFFWGMNGVRQFAALGIWLFSIRFIVKKKLVKYVLFIFLASLFHRSVLLMLPFYFIPYRRLNKRIVWIVLFIVTFILGSSSIFINYIQTVVIWISQKVEIFGSYLRYLETDRLIIDKNVEFGLGFVFKILVHFTIILFGVKAIKKYPNTTIYFVLFFFGAILFNFSSNIQLLGRINNYFLILRSVVLAIMAWYYFGIPRYRIFVAVFCLMYFIIFLSAIYNSSNMCCPYSYY